MLIALLQTHPNLVLSEIAALCGYDLLILDDEHGLFSAAEILQSIRLLNATDTAVWVRIREGDTHAIGRYLDMGADGIIATGVRSAEDASRYVRAMHYPPLGERGFGASVHRGTGYGLEVSKHLQHERGHAALVLMIESASSIVHIESILAVNGVDAAIVGPSDLSANVGRLGDFSTPAYVDALARIERAAASLGKPLGTAAHPGHSVETLVTRGYGIVIAGADTMLLREAMTNALDKTRSLIDATITPERRTYE